MTGAVLLHARGVKAAAQDLSPELSAALNEKPAIPGLELLRMLRAGGLVAPVAIAVALLLSAGSVIFEALLFRGMFDVGRELTLSGQRLWAFCTWAASWNAGCASRSCARSRCWATATFRAGSRLTWPSAATPPTSFAKRRTWWYVHCVRFSK